MEPPCSVIPAEAGTQTFRVKTARTRSFKAWVPASAAVRFTHLVEPLTC